MTDLTAKRILVVGGSSGIGLGAARACAAAGAAVTIASRSRARIDAALATLAGAEGRTLDTTDDAAVQAFFAEGPDWDHVVVSASATKSGPVRGTTLEDAYASMNSKFWGAYRVARAARIARDGSLTLVSGGLAARPRASAVLQGAINAALESLGRGLALELAPVRVNTVRPGLIETPLWDGMDRAAYAQMIQRAGETLPAGRAGTADDVGAAILFVIANGFTTGSTLTVDGGGVIA